MKCRQWAQEPVAPVAFPAGFPGWCGWCCAVVMLRVSVRVRIFFLLVLFDPCSRSKHSPSGLPWAAPVFLLSNIVPAVGSKMILPLSSLQAGAWHSSARLVGVWSFGVEDWAGFALAAVAWPSCSRAESTDFAFETLSELASAAGLPLSLACVSTRSLLCTEVSRRVCAPSLRFRDPLGFAKAKVCPLSGPSTCHVL